MLASHLWLHQWLWLSMQDPPWSSSPSHFCRVWEYKGNWSSSGHWRYYNWKPKDEKRDRECYTLGKWNVDTQPLNRICCMNRVKFEHGQATSGHIESTASRCHRSMLLSVYNQSHTPWFFFIYSLWECILFFSSDQLMVALSLMLHSSLVVISRKFSETTNLHQLQ